MAVCVLFLVLVGTNSERVGKSIGFPYGKPSTTESYYPAQLFRNPLVVSSSSFFFNKE